MTPLSRKINEVVAKELIYKLANTISNLLNKRKGPIIYSYSLWMIGPFLTGA